MMLVRKKAFLLIFFYATSLHAFAQSPVDIAGVPDRSKGAEALYVDAVKARLLEDTRQEENLLKEVIRQKPDEAAPYYDLARLYRTQRKYDQAEELIKKSY